MLGLKQQFKQQLKQQIKQRPKQQLKQERGVTLVELMVSLSIGLGLSAGMMVFAASVNRFSTSMDNTGLLLDSAQYAMSTLRDEIHMAGYFGKYSDDMTVPAALVDPCSMTIADVTSALAFPVQGYNNPATSPITGCLAAANHVAGTDILVIRRLQPTTTALASLTVNDVYLQATSTAYAIAKGDTLAINTATFNLTKKDGATLEDIRKVIASIFFVSPCYDMGSSSTCSSSSDNGAPIPTLKRIDLTSNGVSTLMTITDIAIGVQNLQVEYGIDRSGDGAPDESVLGAADSYMSDPTTVANWNDVVAVQVYLLARSEATGQYTDLKTYTLGAAGSVGPYSDYYKRHVFSANYRVVNVSIRRATS